MKRVIFLILFIFLCIYILPLGIRPLVVPDEVRYAEIPREMVTSGDWIIPRLNGLLYFEKPVMGYWLNGFAMKLFGENAFAVRISSAVSAGLSALMVFFLAARFLKGRKMGVLAATVFLTFFMVYGLGVFSLLDGMFSWFLTACLGFFFLAWSSRGKPVAHRAYMVIAGIFCGFAFLTKGFLAFVLPISVIVPFLVWEKEYKRIFTMSWIPVFTALIVILPWAVLIHLKAPDYWNFFFWNEHVKRFLSKGAQHRESFFYFFWLLPGILFPWTFLTPASIAGFTKKGLNTPLLRYALCWFIFPFFLFSASSGKLITYLLPIFPALGILLSAGLVKYLNAGKSSVFNKGVMVLMGFVGVLMVALVILQTRIIEPLSSFAYADQWKGGLFFMALTFFIFVLKRSLTAKDNTTKILLVAAAPLLLYLSAHFLVPDKTALRKNPGALIQRNQARINNKTLVFSPSTPVRAVCWFLKRDDIFMLDPGELTYGLKQKGAETRLVSHEHFYRLVHENRGKQKIALVINQRNYDQIKTSLPVPAFFDSTGENGFSFMLF